MDWGCGGWGIQLRRVHMKRALLSSFAMVLLFVRIAPCEEPAQPAALPEMERPTVSSERQHALELYKQYKLAEALPLLQKLAQENPNDVVVWESCGVAMASYAQTLTDPAQRKLARQKARTVLLKAQAMGDNSNIVKVLLPMIPEDGGDDVVYSPRKEADAAMQQAEADFAKGDFDKALEGYRQALVLDPKLYDAALFSGDAWFKKNDNVTAGEWYKRAIEINPARETAYRYWGDSLMAQGKMTEARPLFIEAVVAEPYTNRTWTGLSQWAEKNGTPLTPPTLHDKCKVWILDGKMKVELDKSLPKGDPSTAAWIAYGVMRGTWRSEKYKQAHPDAVYRRTLQEEVECLHSMVQTLREWREANGGSLRTDAELVKLMKIDDAGLLEPFVLFDRNDKEISEDYSAYLAAHKDLLVRYLNQFTVPKAGN